MLSAIFAIVALGVAANMLLRADNHKPTDGFPNKPVKAGLGLAIGTISAMMGIGGGTLGVPILSAFGYDIRRAVGTASAIGFIIAIPGALGYILTGWGKPGLPPLSLGYVNLVAFALIIPLSMVAAMAPRSPTPSRRYLSYGFAAFLLPRPAR